MAIQLAFLGGLWSSIRTFIGNLNAKTVFSFLQAALIAILIYKTLMFGYQWAYQRGADSKETELRPQITQLELELVKEKQKLAQLQAVYERAQESSELARQEWERESAALQERLNRRVSQTRVVEQRERQLKNEIEKWVPNSVNTELPNGWVWLYNESGAKARSTEDSPSFGTRGDVSASSGISYTDALHVIIENNAEFVKRGEIIEAWQEYYQQLGSMIEQYNRELDSYYRSMGQYTESQRVGYFELPKQPEYIEVGGVNDINPSPTPSGIEESNSESIQETLREVGTRFESSDPIPSRFLSGETTQDKSIAFANEPIG